MPWCRFQAWLRLRDKRVRAREIARVNAENRAAYEERKRQERRANV